jgi:hypothetical protein
MVRLWNGWQGVMVVGGRVRSCRWLMDEIYIYALVNRSSVSL